MPRLRTFIAIDPGKAIQDRLASLQKALAPELTQIKWVETANLHLTLLFLGEVEDRDTPEVCRVVQQSVQSHKPYALTVEALGCFPNPRRPRTLWVGVGKGAEETVRLHRTLEGPLLDLGCYRREERQFTPHVTLGRCKGDQPSEALAKLLPRHLTWTAGETTVREVHVMSSRLMPYGPEYAVLSRAKLLGTE
jgi:2'-5' RNA ligase